MTKIISVIDKNFKSTVLDSKVPVLVDFWTSWCPPCKMVEEVLEEIAPGLEGVAKIVKINVDQNLATASLYNIAGVPTFIIFNNGNESIRRIGAQSSRQLLDMLKEVGVRNE